MNLLSIYRYAELARSEACGGDIVAYNEIAHRTHVYQALIARRMGMRVGLRHHLHEAARARQSLHQLAAWAARRVAS